ncbi:MULTISPECIES: hypothetical protein [Halorussus]|uniref:hypothetical protein n=1 Tax=Halorussus TaxID=1070314 RepID=UPI00209F93BD|nr:hypothetical protein [Halorussus vallis]USZ75417.1 hypothetical protein NGM07_18535 [Halorussus vallis]
MFPLFGPVPGGMEMLVVLLIAVLLFGLPLVLLGGLFFTYRSVSDESNDEVSALRREVDHLREEVDRLEDEERRDDNRRDADAERRDGR